MTQTRLQLRRGQQLQLEWLGGDEVLLVERGCLVLQAPRQDGGHRVVAVLFPGDLISRDATPPMPGIGVTATRTAAIARIAGRSIGAISDAVASADHGRSFARFAARTTLHAIVLAELTAEQRLATFLLELALRLGSETPAGCTFELPLSRTDMAHYLALNPDTMSRLVSRLKSRGLIATPSRGWATIASVDALAALSPLATVLRQLCVAAVDGHLRNGVAGAGA